jgi:hypothetical protein
MLPLLHALLWLQKSITTPLRDLSRVSIELT